MRLRLPVITLVLIAAVCACSRRDPVANDIKPMNIALPTNNMASDPAGGPPATNSAAASAAPETGASVAIPLPLQGRWGLTPEACTSSPTRAKGLLVVTAEGVRFYESLAVPSANVQTAADSINGDFHFTGEGRAWDKFEALQRSGDKLTRTETNPAASYTYAKC